MRKAKFSEKNLKISAGLPPEARKTPFWKRVLGLLSAPSRKKPGVNVSKIAKFAGNGQLVVVPDKVLGAGRLTSAVNVAAVSFSQSAKSMIEAAGGKAISIVEAAKKSPTGKGLIIIK
ncbi:MAG: 50S ribosomal protein L18e [Candidatus Micrarchaeota archaeon]|nr:50S ribosomal protein L18e [Candidatus Micrarchaeota archaeon]